MARGLMLETTFLIDLERERHRREEGQAHRYLRSRPEERLHVAVTTAGELGAGVDEDERSSLERMLAPFEILGIDLDVCWRYGRAYRYLRENGLLIGANDLWIAAIAIRHEVELVTRDARHFRRIPGLRVGTYGETAA